MPRLEKQVHSGTREKLLALGIQEEKHTFKGLAALFPPEFHIEQANFDLQTLAEVLLHLAKQGLVKLPKKRSPT